MSAPVLILSALPGEQAALRRALGVGARPLVSVREGLWLGITGDGASRARSVVDSWVGVVRPEWIWLLGLGGGLSPNLESGAVVVGERVLMAPVEGEELRAIDLSPWPGPLLAAATLVSYPRLVSTADEKAALWRSVGRPPVACVDLESFAVAEVAQSAGVSISVVRVVSDSSEEDLPDVVVRAASKDGAVRPLRVAAHALFRPDTWGELLGLKRRMDEASLLLSQACLQALERVC